jgi:ABC-type Fe3+/spermidine/putrescine transport system ATPase subunit
MMTKPASRPAPICQLKAVSFGYGLSTVLFDLSMVIYPGECACMLGHNGVGKTTTMRVIAGLNAVDSGDLLYDGSSIRPDDSAR